MALQNGWLSLWEPALGEDKKHACAGVAIFVRSFLGLACPAGGCSVHPGRVVKGMVTVPGSRPLMIYSVYLKDGEGLSLANAVALADFCRNVVVDGDHGVVGGDFNMDPAELQAADIRDAAGLEIVAPNSTDATCVMERSRSVIDYFLVTKGLAKGIASLEVCTDAFFSPHYLVGLAFRPRLASLKFIALAIPAAIQRFRAVSGPIQSHTGWRCTLEKIRRKCARARAAPVPKARVILGEVWKLWALEAERELCAMMGTKFDKPTGRGRIPRMVWRDVTAPPRAKKDSPAREAFGKAQGAVQGLRALKACCHEVRQAVAGGGLERWRSSMRPLPRLRHRLCMRSFWA